MSFLVVPEHHLVDMAFWRDAIYANIFQMQI